MPRLLLCLFCIITFSIVAQAQEAQIAVVNLKDGSSVKGVFIGGDAESVTVKTETTESKIKLTSIKSITFGDPLEELPFKIDPQGKAVVIMYREPFEKTLGKFTLPVYMDGIRLVQLDTTRYFVARVEPGKHSWKSNDKNVKPLELTMNAGQVYYFKMEVRRGAFSITGRITIIPNDIGASLIKQMRPIDREDIKDTKYVVAEISEK